MDEAQVKVLFSMPDGTTTYRIFSLDVGPDDTYNSIESRLSEIVEDYQNGQTGPSEAPEGIEAVTDPHLGLIYEVLTWPKFV